MPRKQSRSSKGDAHRDGYKEVPYRIQEFYAKHPEGALVSEMVRYEVDEVVEETYTSKGQKKSRFILKGYVVMKGLAYRTPDDPHPGVGYSGMVMPGATPYTKGSEIENAETSAWGRAIAALGIAVKEGIATSQEIASKMGYDDEADEEQPKRTRTRKPKAVKEESKEDESEADGEDGEKDREVVLTALKSRVREANELGSNIVNRHSIRKHVAKSEECGEYETLAELYEHGSYDELVQTGIYVAGKIAEATEAQKAA